MEFSIATLLSNFADDKLVAPKILEKKLGCQDETSLDKLQIALDVLEKIGLLIKEKGRYRRVGEEGIVEAKLRCSSKGFCFAIQDTEGAEDIYIRECHLSNAWNGDRVLVKIIKEGSRRRSPEGEVRLILERGNPSVLARVKQTEVGYRAVPLDDRLLFELQLKANGNNLEEAIDHLVHVEVLRYPLGQNLPLGRIAKILGIDAEAANDLDIVCCKHDLPRSFPPLVIATGNELSKTVRKVNFKNRLDLRDVFTIAFVAEKEIKTQESATEITAASYPIEHAITLETTHQTGQWRLGIHVTDVSHFVQPEEKLDRESLKRGTSVHLGETILPMLPKYVSSEVCSLLPEQDRLAISVLITLNAKGQVLEFEIQPTVIHLDELITYEKATAILERRETNRILSPLLEQLLALSIRLQEQRHQRGAFALNLPDSKNPYEDEGLIGATIVYPSPSIRAMITELMILTNQLVGEHLNALGVPTIYRVQPAPDPDDVQELIKLASTLGINLQLESEDTVNTQDIKFFTEEFAKSQADRVLTYQLQSLLRPALYSTTPKPHFGLALHSGYTHFTSPIQRYPDLLVQRSLQAVFELGRDRRTTRAKERVNLRHSSCHGKINWNVLPPEVHHELESRLSAQIVHLTDREKVAFEAQADLSGLQKAGLMKERTGETFPGLITGVQSYGFFVEIELPGPKNEPLRVEGLVHVSSLKDDWYEYRSRQMTLVGRKNRASYRLGDRVEVQVKSVDYYRQQIDLAVVSGGSQDADDYDDAPNSDLSFDNDPYDF